MGIVGGLEVNFVVETSDGTKYYQVAASVRDPSTLEHELAPFRRSFVRVSVTTDLDPGDDALREGETIAANREARGDDH